MSCRVVSRERWALELSVEPGQRMLSSAQSLSEINKQVPRGLLDRRRVRRGEARAEMANTEASACTLGI